MKTWIIIIKTSENTPEGDYHVKPRTDYNFITISGLIIVVIGLGAIILSFVAPFIFISQNIVTLNSTSSAETTLNIIGQIMIIYTISFILMAASSIIYLLGKRKKKSSFKEKY